MAIKDAVDQLQTQMRALSGINSAPELVPESADVFPFAVSYLKSGTFDLQSAGWGIQHAIIRSEIHVGRQLVGKAIEIAMPFLELVSQTFIADPTIGGTVVTIEGISWEFGKLEWGGIPTIGFRWEIAVKMHLTGS